MEFFLPQNQNIPPQSQSLTQPPFNSNNNLYTNQLNTWVSILEKYQTLNSQNNLTDDELNQIIKDSKLLDDVFASWTPNSQTSTKHHLHHPNETSLKLNLSLNEGLHFIDYDTITSPYQDNKNNNTTFFQFDIQFMGQRKHTQRIPINSKFKIIESFSFDFNPPFLDVEWKHCLWNHITSPLHLILLVHEDKNVKIISTKTIDWRYAWTRHRWEFEAKFKGVNNMNNVNVGMVTMAISISPAVNTSDLLSVGRVTEQLNTERKTEITETQEYIQYTKQWWDDYKAIRPAHSSRRVQLFLQTEDHENYPYKPAPCLIEPIVIGRVWSTPYEAARFVSLIPYEQCDKTGRETGKVWHTMHSFLTLLKGGVEDHVVLLCNLWLGFGLDAYIANGITINGPHFWVLTRNKISLGKYKITFWESLTGAHGYTDSTEILRLYKTIHSVFNDVSFCANIQEDDSVQNTEFSFEDSTLWKAIPKDKITKLPRYSITPCLNKIPNDAHQLEIDVEEEWKEQITQFRSNLCCTTVWDGKWSNWLATATVKYEKERSSNMIEEDSDEYKANVKNYIGDGFIFKAFPLHMNEVNAGKIFTIIKESVFGGDILSTSDEKATLAIRCKIYEYPQNIVSWWSIFAMKCQGRK